MASFNYVGYDEIVKSLGLEMERIHRNGPAAVAAGAKIAQEAMMSFAPKRTGGLSKHVKVKGPLYSAARGHYCEVYPDGTNKRGERYATIGFVLEYGRSNMLPRQWMSSAMAQARPAIEDAIVNELMRD